MASSPKSEASLPVHAESLLDTELHALLDALVMKLRRRQLSGSFHCTIATLELLYKFSFRLKVGCSAQAVIDALRSIGRTLLAVAPHEHAIGNCVRRVLYAVRDNCVPKPSGSAAEANRKKSKQPVSRSLLTAPIANIDYHSIVCTQDILGAVSEIIKEIMEDVQSLESNGSEHAVNNFFRTKDVILTSGHSKTVLDFLQFAAKLGLEFEVLVAEAAPGYSGHKMAQELVNFGFKATLIADSAVHAVMPRVHKVVVGAHLVTVDGGLIAQSGTLNMALAAQAHAVPFVVTAGLYKVCPAYAFDQDSFNDALAPWQMVDFLDNTFVQHVDIDNPAFDCVPPTLIALFVTSVQAKDHKENREAMIVGYQPSHLRALTADMYSPEDFEL